MNEGKPSPRVDVPTDPKLVVRQFVDAVNAQDWAVLDRLVSADFVRHSAAAGSAGIRSRDDLIRFLQEEYRTFPEAHEDIIEMMVDGEKVAARHHFRGTQLGALGPYPPTGKVMDSEYIAIYLVRDFQILEAWAEWDNLAGLKQLGHV